MAHSYTTEPLKSYGGNLEAMDTRSQGLTGRLATNSADDTRATLRETETHTGA